MDFGTIFISLIAFTIAALVFPIFIVENVHRNVGVLRSHLRRDYPIDELDAAVGGTEPVSGLWDFLVGQERAHRIRSIQVQHHVLPIMGALVIEVLIFAIAAHKVARGGRTPGVIEDVVVVFSYLLIVMSIYIAYRAFQNYFYFRRYMKSYNEYTAIWSGSKTRPDVG